MLLEFGCKYSVFLYNRYRVGEKVPERTWLTDIAYFTIGLSIYQSRTERSKHPHLISENTRMFWGKTSGCYRVKHPHVLGENIRVFWVFSPGVLDAQLRSVECSVAERYVLTHKVLWFIRIYIGLRTGILRIIVVILWSPSSSIMNDLGIFCGYWYPLSPYNWCLPPQITQCVFQSWKPESTNSLHSIPVRPNHCQ